MLQSFLQSQALKVLERACVAGSLTLITPDGRSHGFSGSAPGPDATLQVHDWRLLPAVRARGDVGLGEAYMSGWWDSPNVESFIAWGIRNVNGLAPVAWGTPLHRLKQVLRERFIRRNTRSGSRRNILAHYDLGNEFYALWLDPTMSYSSAIYDTPGASLEAAQSRKYRRILDILGRRDRVLEIGCGWGGFIEEATGSGREVTALTISQRQHDFVREFRGTAVDLRLQDYRDSTGRYPALVSIEMLEAVGERYWPRYFKTVRERLEPGGVAVVQTITIAESMFASYRNCTDFIRHQIFPGGMLPTVPRIRAEAGKAGLTVGDVYSFGQDYARTLREWMVRFDAAEPAVAALGFDARFRRGWRLYLAMCAAAFAVERTDVHQIELIPVS